MKDKGVIAFTAVASLLVAASGIHRAMSFEPTTAKAATSQLAQKTSPKYGRTEAIVACEMKLERTLRDPGSVRYDRNLTAYVYEDNLHKVALVYNAKNGFGGYAGQDIYTCTFK